METTLGNFGSNPNQKKKGGMTPKGRAVIGLLLGLIAIGLYLGASALMGHGDKGGGQSASSSSSSSGGGFGGFLSHFTSSKADITVCVVTWGGYAGGEYYNGGFKASKDSRYYKEKKITVEFKVMDDYGPSRDAWKNDACNVIWTTADSEVTEVSGLRKLGHDPRIFFQADNSRGGDVFVASNGIKSVQDLRGKHVSFLANSPSETLLLNALDAAGMTLNDIVPVETPSATASAEAFKSGNVDAAVVWSPDDEGCLTKVPGSSVLMSTKKATNIIADVFYAKEKFIDEHLEQLTGFVEGWLTGAAEINSDPGARDKAADIFVANFQGVDKPLALKMLDNVRLSTYGDNLNFFGLNSAFRGAKGEDLYSRMGRMYSVAGKLSDIPPSWLSIIDLRVLKAVKLDNSGSNVAEKDFTFTAPSSELASAPAVSSKPVSVTFPTGSSTLDQNAKNLIDLGFAHTAKTFGGERIRIEGNTDNTGDRASNIALSLRRAKAVSTYLVEKYGFDPNRFFPVGNGPDHPVCTDDSVDCRAKNRRTDFQLVN